MDNNLLAPIVLFVYNRPWHTEKTLNALMNNEFADESILYVFCDGPKYNATDEQILKIKEVRDVVKRDKWCKEVHIVESEKNNGLANSIISGVTNVIEKYGHVIVLEDDLITSRFFLRYMNESLSFYKKYPSVFSISADRPPIQKMQIPADYNFDVFASLRNYSYGWGTWVDKWNLVGWDVDSYGKLQSQLSMKNAFNRGGDDLANMLEMQQKKMIDSWSIRFTYAHFSNHAVSIMPCNSFIEHIGMDGSGTHCVVTNIKSQFREVDYNSQFRFLDIIYEDKDVINAFYNAHCATKRPLWKKIFNRISRMLGGKNVFVIKKKIYV